MKHLKMIDTQEKEQAYILSKDYLSPYVGLTIENSKVTYSRPNSYITITVADGHELEIEFPRLTGYPEEVTLGGGSHKLDMISDYPYSFQFSRGLQYLTAINFDEFTICGNNLRNDSISYPTSNLDILCQGCTSLTAVHIPKQFEVIPSGIFNDCTSLSSVTIDEGVTEILSNVFNRCPFKTIILPKSLEKLGYNSNLPELSTITIPENVTSLDSGCFSFCPKLKTVTFKSKNVVYNMSYGLNSEETNLETLYVQPNLLDAYKTHDGWKAIANKIKPIEE